MFQTIDSLRSRFILALLIIGVILLATLHLRGCSDRAVTPTSVALGSEEIIHMPINMLLDNTMSDYDQTKGFDRDILSFMRRWELKGASFAIMRGDSLLYAKGYGAANDSVGCNVNHVFRIASVSKLITATAVMKLCEQQHLSLSDRVFGEGGILSDSLFADLSSDRMSTITVEHLLRHTSGVTSPFGDPAFSNYSVARALDVELPLSVDDMVRYFTSCRVRYRPGERYDYSNMGYIVLGKIVERVSGMSYESYVQDSILAPAGCYDMFLAQNFSCDRPANEVQYYEVKEAEDVEAYDGSGVMTMKSNGGNNVTLLSSAGGWVASSTELLRFVASINGIGALEDQLSDATIEIMSGSGGETKPIGWASVYGDQWQRSGSMSGTSALIKRQKDGYTWVFITNSSAWIGPYISNHISSNVSRAVGKVKQWPQRDLFQYQPNLEREDLDLEQVQILDSCDLGGGLAEPAI